ncbi:MAG: DegV family protein [Coprobacillus sp.]|nr:DegV family protein [Coprobacillus sp.]
MKIGISAETFSDLSEDLIKEYDINIIHSSVIMGEEAKLDGIDITASDVYRFYEESGNLPRTCAINVSEFISYFSSLLEKYDEIVHISFTSKSSGTYFNALEASKQFNGRVRVIDSLSLSTGIGLLALKASDLVKEGASNAQEIASYLDEYKKRLCVSFVVNTLTYLYKGGRCNGITMAIASVLQIKPQIVLEDGEMHSKNKYRGKDEKIIESYVNDVLSLFPSPDLERVFITSSSEDLPAEMKEKAVKILENRGFKHIYYTVAGATIATHCGPKTLGILFVNSEDVTWKKK